MAFLAQNDTACAPPTPSSFARTEPDCRDDSLMTPTEAMNLMGYSNREAFMRMVQRQGMPRVRINRRVTRFDRQALQKWLRRRSVG